MRLPTASTPPKKRLSDYSILIYGAPKVGKTTFAAGAPKPLFLACEPGLNAIDAYQIPITAWGQLMEAHKLLAAGGHDFQTVVIDTADLAFRYCQHWARERLGVEHESDAAFGKGSSFIRDEFQRLIAAFASLPQGLILISHSQEKEINIKGRKLQKTSFSLPPGARDVIAPMADIIMLARAEDGVSPDGRSFSRRMISTSASETYDAGDRTGRLPDTMPLDYAAVAALFEGGLKTPGPSIEELVACAAAELHEAHERGGIAGLAECWGERAAQWKTYGEAAFSRIEATKNALKGADK